MGKILYGYDSIPHPVGNEPDGATIQIGGDHMAGVETY
jgi:hypothetical protein